VRVALAAAALVLAATLAHDAVEPSRLSHPRPVVVLIGAGALAAALLVLAPRLNSAAVSLGAGVGAGGALATLVSGVVWDGGVPNPLVRAGIAFNLADMAIAVGDALLLGGAFFHAWTNRARLREPV
jgi:lipoprotein signal peptidase